MYNQVNALIHEKSPYLLQHSTNPVNWYPWGDEAFEKAEKEEKPIFLSIGYSTCHWCHVMAKESFEDKEIAALFNKDFICIKVDREERPDIDTIYMNVCQMMTGSGGWPLSIFMTYKKEPFFAATYIPKQDYTNINGLLTLLPAISNFWKTRRNSIETTCVAIKTALKMKYYTKNETISFPLLLEKAANNLLQTYDTYYGGFSQAPKFPIPSILLFLYYYAYYKKETKWRDMADHTLLCMYQGGIYDHIGGGFSRYSTDIKWLVPHFEKMLYDNTLLIYTYCEAIRFEYLFPSSDKTSQDLFTAIIEDTITYLNRELCYQQSAYYCGQDADSDGKEGSYYIFTKEEIITVLGKKEGEQFCTIFDITKQGNFEKKNIPNLIKSKAFLSSSSNIKLWRNCLLQYRKSRYKLHTDDKILTAWNGLAIAALSKAGSTLKKEEYIYQAKQIVAFIEQNLATSKDRLSLRWKDNESKYMGLLDDYSFYAWGLLELYESTLELYFLDRAIHYTKQILTFFYDELDKGFFLSAIDSEKLLVRPKEFYDGAIPSGNSVVSLLFVKLFHLTGEVIWKEKAEEQFQILANMAADYPEGHTFSLYSFLQKNRSIKELLCVTKESHPPKILFHLPFNHSFAVLVKTPDNAALLEQLAPFTASYPIKEKTTFYLCKNGACSTPILDETTLRKELEK